MTYGLWNPLNREICKAKARGAASAFHGAGACAIPSESSEAAASPANVYPAATCEGIIWMKTDAPGDTWRPFTNERIRVDPARKVTFYGQFWYNNGDGTYPPVAAGLGVALHRSDNGGSFTDIGGRNTDSNGIADFSHFNGDPRWISGTNGQVSQFRTLLWQGNCGNPAPTGTIVWCTEADGVCDGVDDGAPVEQQNCSLYSEMYVQPYGGSAIHGFPQRVDTRAGRFGTIVLDPARNYHFYTRIKRPDGTYPANGTYYQVFAATAANAATSTWTRINTGGQTYIPQQRRRGVVLHPAGRKRPRQAPGWPDHSLHGEAHPRPPLHGQQPRALPRLRGPHRRVLGHRLPVPHEHEPHLPRHLVPSRLQLPRLARLRQEARNPPQRRRG